MERQGEGRVDLLTSGQGQQKQQLGQHAVLPLPARGPAGTLVPT